MNGEQPKWSWVDESTCIYARLYYLLMALIASLWFNLIGELGFLNLKLSYSEWSEV
jgi:hypothetical protein